jgi:hypothetical protein
VRVSARAWAYLAPHLLPSPVQWLLWPQKGPVAPLLTTSCPRGPPAAENSWNGRVGGRVALLADSDAALDGGDRPKPYADLLFSKGRC